MRLPIASLFALVSTAAVWAALCGDGTNRPSYHLQSAVQTISTGNDPNNLGNKTSTILNTDLSNTRILHDSTEYLILNLFKGPCEWVQDTLKFRAKLKRQSSFVTVTDLNTYIQLNDTTNFRLSGFDGSYWFGFASRVDDGQVTLTDAIGRKDGGAFYKWYGTATFKDSTRNPESGKWNPATQNYYLNLTSHWDSLKLDSILMTEWRAIQFSENRRGYFQLQIIKVAFDTTPPATSRFHRASRNKTRADAFQAKQVGKMVILQPGSTFNDIASQSLGLYNMMGHQIATLHPTGYAYQWNGKTGAGMEAPPGIYFVQAGRRILGKFFYTAER